MAKKKDQAYFDKKIAIFDDLMADCAAKGPNPNEFKFKAYKELKESFIKSYENPDEPDKTPAEKLKIATEILNAITESEPNKKENNVTT